MLDMLGQSSHTGQKYCFIKYETCFEKQVGCVNVLMP